MHIDKQIPVFLNNYCTRNMKYKLSKTKARIIKRKMKEEQKETNGEKISYIAV